MWYSLLPVLCMQALVPLQPQLRTVQKSTYLYLYDMARVQSFYKAVQLQVVRCSVATRETVQEGHPKLQDADSAKTLH